MALEASILFYFLVRTHTHTHIYIPTWNVVVYWSSKTSRRIMMEIIVMATNNDQLFLQLQGGNKRKRHRWSCGPGIVRTWGSASNLIFGCWAKTNEWDKPFVYACMLGGKKKLTTLKEMGEASLATATNHWCKLFSLSDSESFIDYAPFPLPIWSLVDMFISLLYHELSYV